MLTVTSSAIETSMIDFTPFRTSLASLFVESAILGAHECDVSCVVCAGRSAVTGMIKIRE
jgi:hypothetical protein